MLRAEQLAGLRRRTRPQYPYRYLHLVLVSGSGTATGQSRVSSRLSRVTCQTQASPRQKSPLGLGGRGLQAAWCIFQSEMC